MNIHNYIGLNIQYTEQITEKLNDLLANYSLFYQNVRGFHWNIKGDKFFELHLKFEELYTDLQLKIDEIAERILTLGGKPNHCFNSYFKLSVIEETTEVTNGNAAIENILTSFQTILIIQRELLTLTTEACDEASNSLISDYIKFQEKQIWMFCAYLNN